MPDQDTRRSRPAREADYPGTRELLEDRLRFERTLSEISTSFINLPAERVDSQIDSVLRRIVELLDIDRAILMRVTDEGEVVSSHSFTSRGFGPPPPLRAQNFPLAAKLLLRGEVFWCRRLEELPDEGAIDRASLSEMGVKSHVSIPLMSGDTMLGVLAFGALRKERLWTEIDIERLKLVAHTLINALSRKGADLELRAAFDDISEQSRRLEAEVQYLRDEIRSTHDFTEIIGESAGMRSVLARTEQVAATEATVLILGDTGTGKELIARALHERSRRGRRPLVKVNCASLPEALVESELFGHEKGAFTGALTRKTGRFELADGGTLFLDEVGEMKPDLQAKLLRVLQEGEFERLGSTKTLQVDVRVIAATNRDLLVAIEEGRFRPDLYYRLAVFPIRIPPLSERRDDIRLLVRHFLGKHQAKLGKRIESIAEPTMKLLCEYDWPGNVRELENVIERSLILSSGPEFELEMGLPRPADLPGSQPADGTLAAVEEAHIRRVLGETGWRVKGKGNAADRLGLKESTLRFRMKKLGIERRG